MIFLNDTVPCSDILSSYIYATRRVMTLTTEDTINAYPELVEHSLCSSFLFYKIAFGIFPCTLQYWSVTFIVSV
jgi:hypothetical protein